MNLLGISGSLREGSYNTRLLGAAGGYLPFSVRLRIWRSLDQIPAFNEDLYRAPLPVVALRQMFTEADAILISTPEYNGSVPGALKNALDWASRPFESNSLRDKPVAVVSASQGLFGGISAQAELRKVLRTIGARVDGRELAVARVQDAFTADGTLRDPELATALQTIVHGLLETICRRAA
jgi:chromate reductase